ncbi:MAG: hypothetical protein ACJ75J_18730, partial [Cytophagaceae bacterium]
LDYLNGLEGDEYEIPDSADAKDMAALYDEEDLGKIGQWIKKAAKNVVKAAGKVVKVAAKVGLSPLRNGLLIAMKENLLKVGGKLRYAYLTDAQAAKLNINPVALASLRKIRTKVEKIYEGAGGKKEALRLAVLNGRANRDKKVPLAGLSGLGIVYADQEEYDILHSTSGLGQLGNPAFVAAAMGALKMIATSLNSVKGLFKSGTKEAAETDTPIDENAAVDTSNITDSGSEESITTENDTTTTDSSALPAVSNNTTGSRTTNTLIAKKSISPVPAAQDTQEASQETKGIIAWAKENPLLAAGAVAGTAAIGYMIFRKAPSKGLSGVSGRRKRKKTKAKSKPKTGKFKAITIR